MISNEVVINNVKDILSEYFPIEKFSIKISDGILCILVKNPRLWFRGKNQLDYAHVRDYIEDLIRPFKRGLIQKPFHKKYGFVLDYRIHVEQDTPQDKLEASRRRLVQATFELNECERLFDSFEFGCAGLTKVNKRLGLN